MKRKDYISWDEYFMGLAILSSERSKDPSTRVGACIVNKDNKISLLSACSHRGITNIVTSAREHFPSQKIKYLVGGFHLVDSLPIDTQNIIEYLKSDIPESIGVCHCTGLDSYSIFKNEFKDKVFYNYCGTELYL